MRPLSLRRFNAGGMVERPKWAYLAIVSRLGLHNPLLELRICAKASRTSHSVNDSSVISSTAAVSVKLICYRLPMRAANQLFSLCPPKRLGQVQVLGTYTRDRLEQGGGRRPCYQILCFSILVTVTERHIAPTALAILLANPIGELARCVIRPLARTTVEFRNAGLGWCLRIHMKSRLDGFGSAPVKCGGLFVTCHLWLGHAS